MLVTLPNKNGQPDQNAEIETILVDSIKFLNAVEKHFNEYISRLRNTKELRARENFRKTFKRQSDWESENPIIGIDEPESSAI